MNATTLHINRRSLGIKHNIIATSFDKIRFPWSNNHRFPISTNMCCKLCPWPWSDLERQDKVTALSEHTNWKPYDVTTYILSPSLPPSPTRPKVGGTKALLINTLRPRQNGRCFADDVFKCIFLNENVWIALKITLQFVPKVPINNIPALVQISAWRRWGASHYLNQWWLVYWRIYASLGLKELISLLGTYLP